VAISNFRKAVGKAVAKQRKILGMTQDQVGEKLKVTTQTVSRMENGVTVLTVKRLEQLAEILKCPIGRFLSSHGKEGLQEQAETIASIIQSLPPERRPALVRAVAEIVRALED